VDRWAVLLDLWECEACFQLSKSQLLDVYLRVYDHIVDVTVQKKLRQSIITLIHQRPLHDLSASTPGDSGDGKAEPRRVRYFTQQYMAAVHVWEQRTALLTVWLERQLSRAQAARASAGGGVPGENAGVAALRLPASVSPYSQATLPLLEVEPSVGIVLQADALLDACVSQLSTRLGGDTETRGFWDYTMLTACVVRATSALWDAHCAASSDIVDHFPAVNRQILRALEDSVVLNSPKEAVSVVFAGDTTPTAEEGKGLDAMAHQNQAGVGLEKNTRTTKATSAPHHARSASSVDRQTQVRVCACVSFCR
jgi:hypothetical protein